MCHVNGPFPLPNVSTIPGSYGNACANGEQLHIVVAALNSFVGEWGRRVSSCELLTQRVAAPEALTVPPPLATLLPPILLTTNLPKLLLYWVLNSSCNILGVLRIPLRGERWGKQPLFQNHFSLPTWYLQSSKQARIGNLQPMPPSLHQCSHLFQRALMKSICFKVKLWQGEEREREVKRVGNGNAHWLAYSSSTEMSVLGSSVVVWGYIPPPIFIPKGALKEIH